MNKAASHIGVRAVLGARLLLALLIALLPSAEGHWSCADGRACHECASGVETTACQGGEACGCPEEAAALDCRECCHYEAGEVPATGAGKGTPVHYVAAPPTPIVLTPPAALARAASAPTLPCYSAPHVRGPTPDASPPRGPPPSLS